MKKKLRIHLVEALKQALPGPVVAEKLLKRKAAVANTGNRTLPLRVRMASAAARAAGGDMKQITCRKIGVPECPQGSHETHFVIPKTWALPITGLTI